MAKKWESWAGLGWAFLESLELIGEWGQLPSLFLLPSSLPDKGFANVKFLLRFLKDQCYHCQRVFSS